MLNGRAQHAFMIEHLNAKESVQLVALERSPKPVDSPIFCACDLCQTVDIAYMSKSNDSCVFVSAVILKVPQLCFRSLPRLKTVFHDGRPNCYA
jgi:hypothetical protein